MNYQSSHLCYSMLVMSDSTTPQAIYICSVQSLWENSCSFRHPKQAWLMPRNPFDNLKISNANTSWYYCTIIYHWACGTGSSLYWLFPFLHTVMVTINVLLCKQWALNTQAYVYIHITLHFGIADNWCEKGRQVFGLVGSNHLIISSDHGLSFTRRVRASTSQKCTQPLKVCSLASFRGRRRGVCWSPHSANLAWRAGVNSIGNTTPLIHNLKLIRSSRLGWISERER